eukprot:5345617-Alexandrium_andersonii.AAC.1
MSAATRDKPDIAHPHLQHLDVGGGCKLPNMPCRCGHRSCMEKISMLADTSRTTARAPLATKSQALRNGPPDMSNTRRMHEWPSLVQ